MSYYAIYIPTKIEGELSDKRYVFTEVEESLKVLKNHKDARLKVFKNIQDAENYAQTGFETCSTKFSDLKSPSATAEKVPFRAPTKHELIKFRKLIEEDNYDAVEKTIWENPRYLVNSGDTPTSLKDGTRYNAVHVCAINRKARIAELILKTISKVEFIELLHGKKNPKVCQEVSDILLDYYLNMPEKGRSETPLHLAVKYGAVEVVEVLTAYHQCKMTPNLENQLPKDIICSRMNWGATTELFNKIAGLLEERFYVPVIRSVDNSIPPEIGEPFSPTNPPDLNKDPMSPELEIQAYAGPMSKEQAQTFRRRWKTPPRVGTPTSIITSSFLTPVKLSTSTPSKSLNNNTPTPVKFKRTALFINKSLNTSADDSENANILEDKTAKESFNNNGFEPSHNPITPLVKNPGKRDLFFSYRDTNSSGTIDSPDSPTFQERHPKLSDTEKGLELIGRELGTPLWKKPGKRDLFFSYRDKPFSPLILDDNNSSGTIDSPDSPTFQERHLKHSDTEKGLELIGRELDSPLRKNPGKRDLYFSYRDKGFSPLILDDTNPSEIIDSLDSAAFQERHLKLSDTEKGLELIGRELAKEQKVEWKEYWDFLDCFVDICSPEGLTKLDKYLENRKLNKLPENDSKKKQDKLMNDLCQALSQFEVYKEKKQEEYNHKNNIRLTETAAHNTQITAPYLCVEKSLQVFANRMTKTIIHNIDSVVSINDALISELKRLKSMICSFKDDIRFLNIDFGVIHSRFANLIAFYLKSSDGIKKETLNKIQVCFQQILQSKSKLNGDKGKYPPSDKKEQLYCVSEFILNQLKNSEPQNLPENIKTEQICSQLWQNERRCNCIWDTITKRSANRKKRFVVVDVSNKSSAIDMNQDSKIGDGPDSDALRKKEDGDSTDASDTEDVDGDDDIFWSDIGSDDENEKYFTPPESLSMLEPEKSDEIFQTYNTYISGDVPTKRDLDVLNALFNVDIDKKSYPHIYLWRTEVLRYSNEERDNFPSPSAIIKSRQNTPKVEELRLVASKRLFISPTKQIPSPIKVENSMNHIKPLSASFSDSSNNFHTSINSLSLMNVSNNLI